MKPTPPLLLCLWLSILLAVSLASGTTQGPSSLTCVYDSRATLFCTWVPNRNLTEAPCRLDALKKIFPNIDKGDPKRSCELPGMGLRRCVLPYSEDIDLQAFTFSDTLNLTVSCKTGENWTTVMQQQKFRPMDNIQLRPPDNLQLVNTSDSSYNLTWRLPISSHYLKNSREFEVQYRVCKPGETAVLLPIKQDQEWVKIESFSPDSEYEARVRAKPKEYGMWSNWSKTLVWRTDPIGMQQGYSKLPSRYLQASMPVIVGSVCTIFLVAVIITLIINPRTLKWLKKVLKIYIPDPDKFFPPLSTVHRGDVQKWLSSPFPTSFFNVSSISPEISVLEIIQKENQESQLLLPKAFLTSGAPTETSGHSLSSCFTNQGYFFFHLPDSYEIEPCQVYFTYEAFTRKSSGSEDDDSYRALPSPDLCLLEDDLPLFSSSFLHCIEGNQGFQNSSFVEETESTTNGLGVLPEVLLSPESSSLASVLEQDEQINENVTGLLLSESQQKPGMVISDIPGQPDNDAIQTTEEDGDTDPQSSSTTTMADASSSISQPVPLKQGQADDLHKTASSSQVPNTGAYLSLSELQSQYNHHSV
ncbi:interleukin-2 receptor subunit beta [Emydura macquarii macquarii]|uniref:interleukin-2 receptor subunit beta n=1 Tax=Emydura macquarii macquarii TaxID=1129001 RepID=UPI00352AA057